ncbi:MAG: RluA family pseudouridine synthase [Lachnospirales bacterium]
MREIFITSAQKGQRLDKYLLKYLNKAPKSFIYKMLRKKNIKLNNKKALGSEILCDGDNIKLFLSDETLGNFMAEKTVKEQNLDFKIVYEDENILICNKPKGLICHPDKNNRDNTLNDQLLYYLYKKGEYDISSESDFTPSICNRLDTNTSGIVVMGKNLESVQQLNLAFSNRLVDKYYLTVVKGKVTKAGIVEGYHSKTNDNIAKLGEKGKYILTKYEPIAFNDNYSLLKIKLETGKSHQIRVCMAHIFHPIIGDMKYGDEKTNRFFRDNYKLKSQFLHSYKLIFKTQSGILSYLFDKEFTALPEEKEFNIVKNLFKKNLIE